MARFSLEKSKGATRPVFDLFEACRHTHGTPEESMYWLPQLHKSLFDRTECIRLWQRAGFHRTVLCSYRYRREDLAVGLGVVAYKGVAGRPARELFAPFQDVFADLDADLRDAVTVELSGSGDGLTRSEGNYHMPGRAL